MTIKDETLLAEFRTKRRCEWCHERVKRVEPHHVFSRGAGRLDIRCNLIALCAPMSGGRDCHRRFHDGHILREDLLCIVAAREGVLQREIEAVVYVLRALPKDARPGTVDEYADLWELNVEARKLLARTLEEWK